MRIFSSFSRGKPVSRKFNLGAFHVASPCPKSWEKMIGDERVRHCSECNLNVYNLSAMTEREIEQLVQRNQGRRLCARLYQRADGTVLTRNCPWSLRRMARRSSRFASAMLTAVMSFTAAAARPKSPKPSMPACECRQMEHQQPAVKLTVLDPDGAAIPGAEIALASKSGKQTFTGSTGPSGEWTSAALVPGEYQVTARANGFRTFLATVVIREGTLTSLKLKLAVGELKQTVEVTSQAVKLGILIADPTSNHSTALPPSLLGGQRAPMR